MRKKSEKQISEMQSPGGHQKVDFSFLWREYFQSSATEILQRDELP